MTKRKEGGDECREIRTHCVFDRRVVWIDRVFMKGLKGGRGECKEEYFNGVCLYVLHVCT